MLSVKECKQYLHPGNYTDEQIEHIRDSLYQLADLFITEYIGAKKLHTKPMTHENDNLLPGIHQRTSRKRL